MTQETLTTFFGWMTVIDFGILLFATLAIFVLRDWATALHARMFGLDPAQVRLAMYGWLAMFKVLIFVFALVPYIALRLI